jgi:hypothetical protein
MNEVDCFAWVCTVARKWWLLLATKMTIEMTNTRRRTRSLTKRRGVAMSQTPAPFQ